MGLSRGPTPLVKVEELTRNVPGAAMAVLNELRPEIRGDSLRSCDEHHPEAQDKVVDERADTRGQTTARSAIGLEGVPGTTADDLDTRRIRGRTCRIDRRSPWVWTIPVLTPFQDISFHV